MISIIIPTLNEGAVLENTLWCIAQNPAPHEVIVADGQSEDGTVGLASRHGGVSVVTVPDRGRGRQMNAGATAATGSVFLFLHADTKLRPTSLGQIITALENPSVTGGAFERRFDSPSAFLKFTCRIASWRCRRLGWFLGDQAIFVRKTVFEHLKGFKEVPLFEDLDFSRRLARTGPVATLKPGVISSARRFARKGPVRTTCSDVWLTCRYLAGALPERLGR